MWDGKSGWNLGSRNEIMHAADGGNGKSKGERDEKCHGERRFMIEPLAEMSRYNKVQQIISSLCFVQGSDWAWKGLSSR